MRESITYQAAQTTDAYDIRDRYAVIWYPQPTNVNSVSYSSHLTRDDIKKVPLVNGWREPTTYYASGVTRDEIYIGGTYSSGVNGNIIRGSVSGSVCPTSSPQVQSVISDMVISQRKLGMLNQLQTDKWNAAVALIEARESVSMIAKSATKLERALWAASKLRWNSVAKILSVKPKKLGSHAKDASSGWLQYSFGWLPVIDDMAKSIYHLGKLSEEGRILLSVRATARASKKQAGSGSYTVPYSTPIYGSGLRVDFVDEYSFDHQWKSGLWYRIDVPAAQSLVKYGAIGLDTPWQLLPSSYLIDWVLPVGDTLRALTADLGLQFVGGFETHFRRSSCKRQPTAVTKTESVIYEQNLFGEAANASRFEMQRVRLDHPPSPFQFFVKDPFDAWKAVTSLALLGQRKLPPSR